MIYTHIVDTIGNTPLLEVPQSVTGFKNIKLYAKLENQNPWGSVKDRTSYALLKPYIDAGTLAGKVVLESSSGNTAKALQMLTKLFGGELRIITNLIKLENVKDILASLGTSIRIMPGKSECFDPSDPNDPIYEIQREMQVDPAQRIYTDQFTNERNWQVHYETTAQEILSDLGSVDVVIGGLGTTGSTLGMIKRFKEQNQSLKAFGLVAHKDDFIPGIRGADELFEIGLYQEKEYERIIECASREAIDGMCMLRDKLGVLGGPSAGINFYKSLEVLAELDARATKPMNAVFIVCDRYEWYVDYLKKRIPELFGQRKKSSWLDGGGEQYRAHSIEVSLSDYQVVSSDYLVIDTRVPVSFSLKHIPGALNYPYDLLSHVIDSAIPFSKSQKLLFVCAVGDKSAYLAGFLRTQGYDAASLRGGMQEVAQYL
ncbi:MAG: pyridoxal-phosphate dependent enzyme [Candidatus Pacebacteria bacterium]|nr:pyridoxal-phosphate dependent enzyme [Candidatus Paceibacterota bacterium]